MSKICADICKKSNIIPRLRIKGTGIHILLFKGDKKKKGTNPQTGAEEFQIEILLDEEGQLKTYSFPVKAKDSEDPHYLVQRFASIKEGTKITMEFISKGIGGYIDVKVLDKSKTVEDIPAEEAEEETEDVKDEEGEIIPF